MPRRRSWAADSCSLRTRNDLNSLSFVRKQNGMALVGRARSTENAENFHSRRIQALRRGDRFRDAGCIRPRVCRRLSQLGTADAPLQPAAPLRDLQPARLSAVRCAHRSHPLLAGIGPRRRGRRDGRARNRQGARGRALDGRLHGTACRHPLSATLPVGDRGRLRLGLDAGPGEARGHEGAGGRHRKDVRRRRHRRRFREIRRCPDAPGVQEQGPSRLGRIRPHAGRAFGRGPRPHHAEPSAQAADPVGDGRRSSSNSRCRSW